MSEVVCIDIVDPSTLKSAPLAEPAPFEVYLTVNEANEVGLEITGHQAVDSPIHRVRVASLSSLVGAGVFSEPHPIHVIGGQTRTKEYLMLLLALLGGYYTVELIHTQLSFEPGLPWATLIRKEDD